MEAKLKAYAPKIVPPFLAAVLALFYSDNCPSSVHHRAEILVHPPFPFVPSKARSLMVMYGCYILCQSLITREKWGKGCTTSVQTWTSFCFAPQRSEREGESAVRRPSATLMQPT